MKMNTLNPVREAPSPGGAGLRQVHVYEYLLGSMSFRMEARLVGDFPAARARRADEAAAAFLSVHFADPRDRGRPALTEKDAEPMRAAAGRGMDGAGPDVAADRAGARGRGRRQAVTR